MSVAVGLDGSVVQQAAGVDAVTLAANGDGTQRVVSFDRIYASQPVVYALVNKLVRHISTLPLKVYEVDSAGMRRPVDDPSDDLVRLLRHPADRYGQVHLLQWLTLPWLVNGNAVVAKYRGNGHDAPPTELLPMDWRYLSAYAPRGGPITYWVTSETGDWRAIDAAESIHVAWNSPTARDVGLSPLEALGTTIRLDDAARRYQTSNFENTARPSGLVVVPPDIKLTEDQKTSLRRSIEEMHKGVDNAFKVALMGGGVEWKPISFTAQEAELISTRQITREEACIAYDVAPTVIGDLTHGTYSNVSELRIDFYRSTLRPLCKLLEDTLKAHLLDPEPTWRDRCVEFDMSEQLRGTPAEQEMALKTAVESGGMTLNEAREARGMLPVSDENANKLLVPTNNLEPVDRLGQTPAPSMPAEPPVQ